MKILLLGEYSNVHSTLAKGLRSLGHTVDVASDGDGWKNYERNIDTARQPGGALSGLRYWWQMHRLFDRFRGYDVVQLINPVFLSLKAERLWSFYRQLQRHNRCVVLGAFGTDHAYVDACVNKRLFDYSDFTIYQADRKDTDIEQLREIWLDGSKGILSQRIAQACDAIVAGLYEYYASYQATEQRDKLRYIPFPIDLSRNAYSHRRRQAGEPLRLFIGIQSARNAFKGTDIMLRAAERVVAEYPGACELCKAENLPFDEYVRLFNSADVILDQLYAYTPAMNALEAMAHGLVVVGGGEPEAYHVLPDRSLQPVVNVKPDEASVYEALRRLVEQRDTLVPELSRMSRQYIERYHNHIQVARQYETLYRQLLSADSVSQE